MKDNSNRRIGNKPGWTGGMKDSDLKKQKSKYLLPALKTKRPMTFPQQLHDIINDPVKEKAVLDLIQRECLKEYGRWRDAEYENTDGSLIGIGSLASSANLLCRFLGVTKEE